MFMSTKTLCLIDGEHYIPVTKNAIDTLNSLEHIDVVAAVFIGGTEKLREDNEDYYSELLGIPVFFGPLKNEVPYEIIQTIAKDFKVDRVMDLSDEPVLDYSKRFKIACNVIADDIIYEGPDFKFEPVSQYDIPLKPSIKILGTGKRIGKTAVSGFVSRLLDKNNYDPCVVAMGRGGPEEPEIVRGDELKITPEFLLEQSNKGIHAASDHWEDALMSRILTIGCRRCGGGMAGEVFLTNMKKGAEIANEVDSKFIIFEGSGAAIPPIKTNKNIVLIGANQPLNNIKDYFGPYRIAMGDLVIITMCEEPIANKEKIDYIVKLVHEINPNAKVIATVFRPKPLGDIKDKKVLFATTAPDEIKEVLSFYLESEYGCKVIATTSHLSDRPLLKKDLNEYIDDVDIVLTELKAAAVDVVTKESIEMGLDVVYCDNIPIVCDFTFPDLENAVLELVDKTIEDFDNS
ncbi:2,3-diphosphoglycerate synthetase [Methanobrevibacter sp. DSM 116169]|uniref:2,3-diphosphoglycerate synthetase n=1 Tax=Methanobrevibacter sp. DSM 116169 TaxID=3242727 RepID=UPI0038FC70A6